MKIRDKILVLMLGLFVGFGMSSCSNEMMDYHGEESVYFAVQYGAEWGDTTLWCYFPLTTIDFVKFNETETVSKVRVAITGRVKDYDRKVKVVIEQDSTTAIEGVNYKGFAEDYIIAAGAHYVDIPINITRADNIMEETKRLSLKLIPTDDFTLSMPVWDSRVPGLWPNHEFKEFDNTRHYILMSDFLVRPKVWPGTADNAAVGTTEVGTFGQFSPKKFRLMVQVMEELGVELVYSDFSSSITMPSARTQVIKDAMIVYLKPKYEAGEPVLEADGRPMWVSGVGWTSKIGVPYVPVS